MAKKTTKKTVETLTHDEASRKNIPTAEFQSVMRKDEQSPIQVAYERRNRDLDPQLVWRGKDEQDWSDLVVQAPPLYIQEKVHPKVLIDDLRRQTEAQEKEGIPQQIDLFADFNGLPDEVRSTEFYQHDANWSNRMILGDSLQVMASLAEREGLRGKVQCIYIDPPYGIKFNSNFQWSTTNRDVKDGKVDHITREPEQVKAFRDTWRDGIHSYLTYLRDRLTIARDLLTGSGSIFVQIGDENVHRVRALLDEVFGEDNFIGLIWFRKKTMPLGDKYLERMGDYIIWCGKDSSQTKFRRIFKSIDIKGDFHWNWRQVGIANRQKLNKKQLEENPLGDPLRLVSMWPPSYSEKDVYDLPFRGKKWAPAFGQCYPSSIDKLERVAKADRLEVEGKYLRYVMKLSDDDTTKLNLTWPDTIGARDQRYVVETNPLVVQRCLLLTTDPGDLVLDPTCGSGSTAFVAEQWGRRWITIDTSRVALALARARVMGARYPYYLLADSRDGQIKKAELADTDPSEAPTHGNVRQGFVCERVLHINLKSIANNTEIDVIWEKYQERLEPLREQLNKTLKRKWQEWEIPRDTADEWPKEAKKVHAEWWKRRIARQKEMDASIAANADFEYLYDKPYKDNRKVRVAGPFTVESLSPHRILDVDENDELIDNVADSKIGYGKVQDFAQMILENLKTSGVQQAHKEDRISFSSIAPWPGKFVCAEGIYFKGDGDTGVEKRAAIFIGPEFGTVSRPDLVAAAREAGDAGFDALIACAFNYDAHSSEFENLGRIPILKARMNADLHMADDLKNTGKGNLFVIFGEPDIDIMDAEDGQIQVKINGVDVFHPNTGEVRSDGAEGIACWFIDTDYNEESFFVRHAYFLGANDPYKALKTTLKAEINQEAWDTLNSDTSRPFDRPKSGRIAVKVINHLGDEVMKVFRVE
ncbi:MAG: site-specific DNA-methyltransferase [Thermodesulfobacteriota bacterium]|nr:site-specific DNA-methyltransferase [Thermodesulfobacteriota bacterium]